MRQKGGARCLCLATQCSCSGQRVGVAKRGNPVEEAEPDHVDRRFKFVSRWSFPDQRWNKNKKSWLASCWPESVFLCLGPPSLLQPYWGCWTIPQILPPPLAGGGVSPQSHLQAGRAVLHGSLALEEEEK